MRSMFHLYARWMRLPVGWYILISVLGVMLLQMPMAVILHIVGVDLDEIGGPGLGDMEPIVLVIAVILVAPVLETALCQMLPVRLLQFILHRRAFGICVVVSTLFFSALHVSYSVWYGLLIVPAGWILAVTYLRFQQRQESAFWVTTAVHAGRNAIGVLAFLAT